MNNKMKGSETARYSAWGYGWGSEAARRREDDERSVGSTFSRVSMIPTQHAARRCQERVITERDIKEAKAQGKMSLSIHLNGIEDTNGVKDEIIWWGGRLKEAFEQLEVGEVIQKGREDRRLEVELHGSENFCPAIKEWLKGHDYFREKEQQSADMKEWLNEHGYMWEEKERRNRVLFTLRQGQEVVVVVEGRITKYKVGVITTWADRVWPVRGEPSVMPLQESVMPGSADDPKVVAAASELPRPPDFHDAKLFVGLSDWSADDEQVKRLMETYGNVEECYVIKAKGGASKGCALVRYADKNNGNIAIAALNGKVIMPGGQALTVKWADRKPQADDRKPEPSAAPPNERRLFLGSYSWTVTDEDLMQLVQQFGDVEETYVMKTTGASSKGCALVKFKDKASGQRCIDELHKKHTFEGAERPIVVKWHDPPKVQQPQPPMPMSNAASQPVLTLVHQQVLALSIRQMNLTKAQPLLLSSLQAAARTREEEEALNHIMNVCTMGLKTGAKKREKKKPAAKEREKKKAAEVKKKKDMQELTHARTPSGATEVISTHLDSLEGKLKKAAVKKKKEEGEELQKRRDEDQHDREKEEGEELQKRRDEDRYDREWMETSVWEGKLERSTRTPRRPTCGLGFSHSFDEF
jgi:RNA recognition motif-containing protein